MCKHFAFILMPVLLVSCGKQGGSDQTNKPVNAVVETAAANTNTAATSQTVASSEFTALKGKWTRTDGDYILEIKEVAADGKMDAGYFNPNPINISKAMAIKESAGTKVFVELQDTGYPGCTYSLTFDAATSQLHGQYFQAAMQQTYDVVFAKVQE